MFTIKTDLTIDGKFIDDQRLPMNRSNILGTSNFILTSMLESGLNFIFNRKDYHANLLTDKSINEEKIDYCIRCGINFDVLHKREGLVCEKCDKYFIGNSNANFFK